MSGDLGSLYFPDNQLLTRMTTAITMSGQWMASGLNSIHSSSLILDKSWLRFPNDGFLLEITNNLVVSGTDTRIHKLEMFGAVVDCGGDVILDKGVLMLNRGAETGGTLYCAGNLMVSNGAAFHVQGGISANPQTPSGVVNVLGDVITSGASWIYPHSHPTNGGSVRFEAANFDFGSSGGVNAVGLGYKGGDTVNCRGFGPGGGWASNTSGGGSYGGLGGNPNSTSITYGDYRAPVEPGSGGGSGQTPGGGAGGGAVWLETPGVIRLDGSILADAPSVVGNYLSGGSGGGIYLQCRVIRGDGGVLSANGGSFSHTGKGGGGGGRIAVIYDVAEQDLEPLPSIRFSTLPGTGTVALMGDMGTVFFPDNRFLTEQSTVVQNSGTWYSDTPFTNWDSNGLVFSNTWLRLPKGVEFNVNGALVVTGTDPVIHKLEIDGSTVNCGSLLVEKNAGFIVKGDIVSDPSIPGAEVNVDGEMRIGPNAWVYPTSHPTNGGSPKFNVGSLTIDATGGFDAVGRGFAGGEYGGGGFGPGGGLTSSQTSDRGGGGGYGAEGSTYGNAIGGATYGSADAPTQPGSGGGSEPRYPLEKRGGAGGGLVWVEAEGAINLGGTINVNGGRATGNSGGGSGGGVNLRCATFDGAGSITANGGEWYVGGGGGRIAVVYTNLAAQAVLNPTVKFNAASHHGNVGTRSFGNGTLYLPDTTFFPYPVLTRGAYNIEIPTMLPVWNTSSLVVTNAEVHFTSGASINFTGELTVGNGGIVVFTNNPEVAFGNLTITNGGIASFFAEPTNGQDTAYGAKVQVDGTMLVGSGSTVNVHSHRFTGGSVFFNMRTLEVNEGGKIDADERGFANGGARGVDGYGPGAGVGHYPSDRSGAGGYGGRGASHPNNSDAAGGDAYGDAILPIYPGSGGGDTGGAGGGLVWMRVLDNALVNGAISANGAKGAAWTKGDGAGGGILLDCGSFAGSGTLTANGGLTANATAANGGGGRIAVWENVSDYYRTRFFAGNFGGAIVSDLPTLTFTGTATATAGPNGHANQKAEPGTIVFLTTPPIETLIIVR